MGKMCLVIVLLVVGMFSTTVIAMDSPKPTKLSQYYFTEANNNLP